MRAIEGGDGGPQLVILHGLGATADVWAAWGPLLAERWPGRWIAPDLPGHGGSAPLDRYTFDGLAAALVELVDPDGHTVVLGHSLGGVVGLALAARVPVAAVIGLGIKVAWTADELARAAALAERPVTWFDTRDEAAARYLRVAGLDGLLDVDAPSVDAGLVERDGRWRLALDPAAFGVGAPDMPGLIAGARADTGMIAGARAGSGVIAGARAGTGVIGGAHADTGMIAAAPASVVLARGANDPMNTDEQLAALGVPVVTLPGLGHNAHVEDPRSTAAVLPSTADGWSTF